MMRNQPQSGEIFEPKSVRGNFSLDQKTRTLMPYVFDTSRRQITYVDLSMKSKTFANSVTTHKFNINLLAKAVMENARPSLYDLLLAHVTARGTLTPSLLADTIVTAHPEKYDKSKQIIDINQFEQVLLWLG